LDILLVLECFRDKAVPEALDSGFRGELAEGSGEVLLRERGERESAGITDQFLADRGVRILAKA